MTTKYICSAVVPFISGSVLKRGGLKHGDIPCITEPCFKKKGKKGGVKILQPLLSRRDGGGQPA